MSSVKVLYEDNHIIAVVKPAGLLTQGDKSGEASLYDMVKDYIRIKKGKPLPGNARPVGNSQPIGRFPARSAGVVSSGVFLGLVHRLDKPVQGIVLFGKTSKGASRLSEQFREHTIQKTYHAIVVGKLDKQKGEIKEKVNKISFFAEGFTNKTDAELLEEIKKATKTRTAELSWEVVKSNDKYSLLKIMPKTGRFHQIRIQMANMGHPILGDAKYSTQKPLPDRSIALCATAISFKTATLQPGPGQAEDKVINLEIPLPEEWESFLK
ncbi:MAG: RNA pseudouridine synthase [Patescibacteria group bacterium]|jgi:23S rRNA pseudouridine1911/1915/1917 synthase